MSDIDDIYSTRLFEIAASIPNSERLEDADATASAHSKLCGSTITVDLKVEDGRVTAFGQTVKACLLGQAAAAIVGREINGTSEAEFRDVAEKMRSMLKAGGAPPTGRWEDLRFLQPVRDYPARHTSTLLVFDAVIGALSQLADDEPTAQPSQSGS